MKKSGNGECGQCIPGLIAVVVSGGDFFSRDEAVFSNWRFWMGRAVEAPWLRQDRGFFVSSG